MIYIDDHIDDFDLREALAAVSQQRRDYALRYRQERDQRLCLAAYRLLQRALMLEYGINGMPVFCHEAVAVALSDHPVGIDIETSGHYSPEVARRVMNDNEMREIVASALPEVTFTRLWTMKESLYKLTGDDHGGDIAQMLDNATRYRFTTTIHSSYLCTICSPMQS